MAHEPKTSEITTDGRLDKAKILTRHPQLKTLYNDGIECITWTCKAEELWPDLPDIAQQAGNAKYSVQSGTDPFQCYIRACKQWLEPNNISASVIADDIIKSNPKATKDVIHELVEVARKWGGSQKMIGVMEEFLSANMRADATIPLESVKTLSNLKQSTTGGEVSPFFINSILMLWASAPSKTLKPSSTDVRQCMSSKSKVDDIKTVESSTKSLFEAAQSMQIPTAEYCNVINETRLQLCMKFFNKVKTLELPYLHYVNECFKKLLELAAADARVPNPFKKELEEAEAEAEKQKKSQKPKAKAKSTSRSSTQAADNTAEEAQLTAVQYDDNMNVVGSSYIEKLRHLGFVIDKLVKNKKSGQTFIRNCLCVARYNAMGVKCVCVCGGGGIP